MWTGACERPRAPVLYFLPQTYADEEMISGSFIKVFGSWVRNEFALKVIRRCDKIALENGSLDREAFAHMFEALFDREKYTLLQKYFPSAMAEFLRMLEELI